MARFTAAGAWQRDADRAARQHDSIDQTQYVGTKGDDHIHGRKGPDTIDGRAGDDRLAGRAGDDVLLGGKGNDVLVGAGGVDRLEGGAGDDILKGGVHFKELTLGRAADLLDGGDGRDRLIGGYGPNTMSGGSGSDQFIYRSFDDSGLLGSDTITDFTQGEDRIVFQQEFTSVNLHFVGQEQFSGAAGEIRYVLGDETASVQIDLDGDGAADFDTDFTGAIHFQASDFSF